MCLINLFCFSRRFETAGLSFRDHSFHLPLVNRNISGGTIGLDLMEAGLRRHASNYHLELLSASECLTSSDLLEL